MKITIITVVYNGVNEIEATIQSVLSQDFKNIEYFVIDGGSSDGTNDVILKYQDKISYYISEKDNGMYDALNKGVKRATGEWIGILNCGDLFCDEHVLTNMFCKPIEKQIGVVYGDCNEIDGDKTIYHPASEPIEGSKVPPTYRHGASFIRNEVHKRFLYDLSSKALYGYGLDYLQIYTMNKNFVQFKHIPVLVLNYKKEGLSNNGWRNKYNIALIENEGKKNIKFVCKYTISILAALFRRVSNFL